MLSLADALVLRSVNQHPSTMYHGLADSTFVFSTQNFFELSKVASVNWARPKDVVLGAKIFSSPLFKLNVHSVPVHCLPLLSVCMSPAMNAGVRWVVLFSIKICPNFAQD